MTQHKKLNVYLAGKLIGTLIQNTFGKLEFTYFNTISRLSVSLPYLPHAKYDHKTCQPFFEGLLPEGEGARRALTRNFGIRDNTFNLLQKIGHECAGAVSIVPYAEPVIEGIHNLNGRILTKTELALHISELPKKPLFVGVDGMRLSLAGAQDKAAVCLINGEIAIPSLDSISTHLLKPEILGYPGSVQNEYFCLKLAERIGLQVPEVTIGEADGLLFLLIERYDRQLTKDNQIVRVHQEDFCQALGILPTNKYESHGGPSLEKCFDLVKHALHPTLALSHFLPHVIFNYSIGNNDAHAKNFSLLHKSSGFILSPVYDVMSTAVYSQLSSKMAMKIGGHYESDQILYRHWLKLCHSIEYSEPGFVRLMTKFCNALPKAVEIEYRLMQKLNVDMTIVDKICELILRKLRHTRTQFGLNLKYDNNQGWQKLDLNK